MAEMQCLDIDEELTDSTRRCRYHDQLSEEKPTHPRVQRTGYVNPEFPEQWLVIAATPPSFDPEVWRRKLHCPTFGVPLFQACGIDFSGCVQMHPPELQLRSTV